MAGSTFRPTFSLIVPEGETRNWVKVFRSIGRVLKFDALAEKKKGGGKPVGSLFIQVFKE